MFSRSLSSLVLGLSVVVMGRAWPVDGGAFQHVASATVPYYRSWPIGPDRYEYTHADLGAPRQARAVLDGGSPEAVWVYTWNGVTLAVTQGEPRRLWIDRDGDNRAAADEIMSGTLTTGWYYRRGRQGSDTAFPNAVVPVPIGDASRFLECDLSFSDGESGQHMYVTNATLGHYEGRIRLEGGDYAARMDYRVFYDRRTTDRLSPIVTIDSRWDGVLDHDSDEWFACDGIARIAGRLYQVSSSITEDTAEVRLEPYGGATGRLHITGVGSHRVHLEYAPSPDASGPVRGFPVEGEGSAEYELPEGAYRIISARIVASPTLGYALSVDERDLPGVLQPRVVSGRDAAEVPLGGPFRLAVEMARSPLRGRVRLEPGDYTNAAGLTFNAIEPGRGGWELARPLSWELTTPSGRRISAGRFSYG
ncbi:hypothetical protein HS125_14340 [bacterium]|nr:hypothetical protein [bacterium]